MTPVSIKYLPILKKQTGLYPFQNQTLTPIVIAHLWLAQYNGKSVTPENIKNWAQSIRDYHLQRGGKEPVTQDYSRAARDALNILVAAEWAERDEWGAHNCWRIFQHHRALDRDLSRRF